MKKVFTLISFFFIAHFSFFAQTSKQGQDFFKEETGFFFFIGVDNYSSVHLVWDEIQNPALKEFILERSEDGKQFSEIASRQMSSEKLPDLMGLSKTQLQKIIDAPYNQLLYTTETGPGRFIYNQIIPEFMAGNKKYQWYYRLKFIWKDEKITFSAVRSFDFYFDFRKQNGTKINSQKEKEKQNANEIKLSERETIFSQQADALKTVAPPVVFGPCPSIQIAPSDSCPTGNSQNFSGTCCTWTQGEFFVESPVNCAGKCCCNIDCSPGGYDSCCVHTCSQHNICGCTPWVCCSGANQWVVTQSTSTSTMNITINTYGNSCLPNDSATVNVSGGTPPYSFSWSNGQTTQTATGLTAGTYSVTVNDSSCVDTKTFTITPPVQINLSGSGTNPVCNGGNNGSASISASGGTLPYSYNWSNGGTTQTITGLSAGNYSVVVADSNGCSATNTITISNPFAIVVALSAFTNCSCYNSSDGSASVNAYNGTSPYTFVWSNGQTGQNATGLQAGNYIVTVTDSNDCTGTHTITIYSPSPLTASVSVNNPGCYNGNNGTATVNANGGIAPYSYSWSNGQTSQTITGLSAGNYTVTVMDNNGCTNIVSVSVANPPALLLSVISTPDSGNCNGTVSATPSGGNPPYTYLWNNGCTTSSCSGLCAGAYAVNVWDSNGCSWSISISVGSFTGIVSPNENSEYEIYPSPATSEIFIEFSRPQDVKEINIIDVLARTLLHQAYDTSLNKIRIDVSALASGYYLLLINSAERKHRQGIIIK
ncbi:MAG: T9SS type A sorting domain-containing protein [Bacteroidetes bacterium]|nr:T9SS type A sorting domain-containing protein [Bacteroidota bacterium]